MTTPSYHSRTIRSAMMSSIVLASGCVLPHAGLPASEFGSVSPQHYCPGDTVAARYDLMMDTACVSRPGFDCATVGPEITISSSPTSFPTRTFNTLADGLTFMPTAPRVDVTFAPPISPTTFLYPIVNSTSGMPGFYSRKILTTIRPVSRIDGAIDQSLTHGGVCNGSTPMHVSAQVGAILGYSPNLRLQQLCNTSTVPIIVTLSGGATEFTRPLDVGQCFSVNEPGSTIDLSTSTTVSVRSQVADPTAQCDALQGMTPPQPLTTRAVLACGN